MSEQESTTSRRTVLGLAVGTAAAGAVAAAGAAPAAASAPRALADESARASAQGVECVADLR
jgi:hypothetical protein